MVMNEMVCMVKVWIGFCFWMSKIKVEPAGRRPLYPGSGCRLEPLGSQFTARSTPYGQLFRFLREHYRHDRRWGVESIAVAAALSRQTILAKLYTWTDQLVHRMKGFN